MSAIHNATTPAQALDFGLKYIILKLQSELATAESKRVLTVDGMNKAIAERQVDHFMHWHGVALLTVEYRVNIARQALEWIEGIAEDEWLDDLERHLQYMIDHLQLRRPESTNVLSNIQEMDQRKIEWELWFGGSLGESGIARAVRLTRAKLIELESQN